MADQKYREHHQPRAADEALLGFTEMSSSPRPVAVTITDSLEQTKEGASSGVLGRLPAATD